MSNTHSPKGSRHVLARIVLTAAVTALPVGFLAVPASAAPPTAVDRPWQQDCDHTGHFGWQENRGHSEWADCDNDHGHWQWQNDRDGRGDWRWHNDRDDVAPPPPAPWWFGLFGSI